MEKVGTDWFPHTPWLAHPAGAGCQKMVGMDQLARRSMTKLGPGRP